MNTLNTLNRDYILLQVFSLFLSFFSFVTKYNGNHSDMRKNLKINVLEILLNDPFLKEYSGNSSNDFQNSEDMNASLYLKVKEIKRVKQGLFKKLEILNVVVVDVSVMCVFHTRKKTFEGRISRQNNIKIVGTNKKFALTENMPSCNIVSLDTFQCIVKIMHIYS